VTTASTPSLDPATPSSPSAVVVAGVLGALAVAFGAFGAHALKTSLADAVDGAQRLQWWQTGAQYHLAHALLAGLLAQRTTTSPRARVGLVLCVVGVVLFSGSLYAMALTGVRWLGAITPLGGVAFIVAWLMLAASARVAPKA
jgi:uncharacterized membrane protein YgdD (TMEM256/DUF423 family)